MSKHCIASVCTFPGAPVECQRSDVEGEPSSSCATVDASGIFAALLSAVNYGNIFALLLTPMVQSQLELCTRGLYVVRFSEDRQIAPLE